MAKQKGNQIRFSVHEPLGDVRGEPKVMLRGGYLLLNKMLITLYFKNKNKVILHKATTMDGMIIAFEPSSSIATQRAIPLKKTSSYLRVAEPINFIVNLVDELKNGKKDFTITMLKVPFVDEKIPSILISDEDIKLVQ